MSRQRKSWESLSDAYRRRLERGGISRQAYESGASLSAARGHRSTPERPADAVRNPGRYAEYLARNPNAGKEFPAFVWQADPNNLRPDVRDNWSRRDKTTIAKHWNAVARHRMSHDDQFARLLGRFENTYVGGYGGIPKQPLETRQSVIDQFIQQQTEDRFETLYEYAAQLGK
ncbi:hypothetical protein HUO13_26105 [Saccharopolyspora erythraea]|uniref:hypothetical protein n=1 Tax=Saccharopolyspora erythraea TaxID=1836 RepID=UPI001BAD432A|nr:hypothetical protein [Saccharopolyspora erythraea]QUH03825.1 hypothetical protein HUO13_26105 [Saccharopolyspora erythraea]